MSASDRDRRQLDTSGISLQTDLDGTQWLHHALTGEVKKIAETCSMELALDENIGLVVQVIDDPEAPSTYAQNYLRYAFYRDSQGLSDRVFDAHAQRFMTASDFSVMHRRFTLALYLPGGAGSLKVDLYCFTEGACGQHWWWKLPPILRATLLPEAQGKRKKEVHLVLGDRMRSWQPLLGRLGVPQVRKARPQRPSDSKLDGPTDDEIRAGRVLRHASICTGSLLIILQRMAFNEPLQGGCKSRDAAANCKTILDGMLRLCSPMLSEILLSAEPDREYGEHGRLVSSDDDANWRSFVVADGAVDFEEFHAWALEHIRANSLLNSQYWTGSGTLINLLEKLARVPSCCLARSVIVQILRHAGVVLEAFLDDAAGSLLNGQKVPFLTVAPFAGLSAYQRHQDLCRYVAACRAEAAQFQQVYSFGTDASRVGYKARSNFAFVYPNNVLAFGPPADDFGHYPPQVLKDIQTGRGLAFALDDVQALAEAQNEFVEENRRRLSRKRGGGFLAKSRRKYRKKSFQYLCLEDSAIKLMMDNEGFKSHFVSPEKLANLSDPYSWNLARRSSDKGPEMISSSNFLRWGLRLNIEQDWDKSHGAWRSCLDAVNTAGMLTRLTLLVMAFNTGYGEWKDGSRGEQIRISTRDSLQTLSDGQDIPYQACLPQILEDRGKNVSTFSSKDSENLRKELLDNNIWDHNPSKLNLTRFFNPIDRHFEWERDKWGERQYGLMTTCFELGLMKLTKEDLGGGKSKDHPAAPEGKPKASSSQSHAKQTAYSIKRAAGNPVYFGFITYADKSNRYIMEIISSVVGPLREWHTTQSTEHRSATGAFKWESLQAGGRYWQHIDQTIARLGGATSWLKCGMRVDTAGDGVEEGAEVSFQDMYAGYFGNMVVALAGSRLEWGLDYIRGFPRKAIMFLTDNPRRTAYLNLFTKYCDIIDKAMASADADIASMGGRSHMRLTPVLQLRGMLRLEPAPKEGLTPKFAAFLKQRSNGLHATQLLEDSFNTQKAMVRQRVTHRVDDENAYFALLHTEKGVQSKHHYDAPKLGSVAEVDNDLLKESAFHPSPGDAWRELDKIVGREQEPSWHHPAAGAQNFTIAELLRLEAALPLVPVPKPKEQSVMAGLLSGRHLIVRVGDSEQRLLVLKRACDLSFFGWPVQRKEIEGRPGSHWYELQPSGEKLHMINMLDHARIEAEEYEWWSPMHQRVRFPNSGIAMGPQQRPRAVKVAGPLSLKELAARRAFFSLSKSWCVEFGKLIDVEVASTDHMWDVLATLICAVVPDLTDDGLLEIMHRRCFDATQDSSRQDLRLAEACRDNLTKD
ncbi:unnamed protein product [Prorocentrum cordatum]|uniref:RNA-directed RNA polymerase n=1 Tax=Prorocentrum cordatum TaxID=2364126 RepID=A0ABN9QSA6_9DINO|nr:unnamed protein product [Polarella glacialis]